MVFEDLFSPPPSLAAHSPSSGALSSGTYPSAPAASSTTTAALSSSAAPSSSHSPLNIHNDHISNYVKFKLDPAENNFSKWRTFFRIVLLQYRVQDHVDSPPPRGADVDWLAVD